MCIVNCCDCARQIIPGSGKGDEYVVYTNPQEPCLNLGFGKWVCPECKDDYLEWEEIDEARYYANL